MQAALQQIIDIQDLDMKMIRLMRLKRERRDEQAKLHQLRAELHEQMRSKQQELNELKRAAQNIEFRVSEILERIKKLENQQLSLKKIDDFNACTHEINLAERERQSLEGQLNEILEKASVEEEILDKIQESLTASADSSQHLEEEIEASIKEINQEGLSLQTQRELLVKDAPQDLLSIYERLLKNKRDRVVVPVEQRACSGCHVILTPQQENLVRQGDRLIFCEHCGRVLYWMEPAVTESATGTKRRRRRTATSAVEG